MPLPRPMAAAKEGVAGRPNVGEPTRPELELPANIDPGRARRDGEGRGEERPDVLAEGA